MKIKRILALFLAVVLLFGGCSAKKTETRKPEKITPFYEDELPAIGNIYVTCDNPNLVGVIDWTTLTAVKENYSKATVRVEWEEGDFNETECEIKVRGNSSAEVAKKSYTVKFKEKTNFMNMGEAKKWALLASPFDKSLLRVGLAFEYAEALGIDYTSKFRYCKLWLNGEYRGIYVAMETVGEGRDRVDIDLKNGDALFECDLNRTEQGVTYITVDPNMRLQINEPEKPTRFQIGGYESFLYNVCRSVQSRDYTVYEQVIDVDSFVDFFIFNELVKDIDFGEFSTRYYMKDGKLHAGPPWDMDLSMGNVSEMYYETKYDRYHNKPAVGTLPGYGTQSGDSTEALWVQGNYYQFLVQDSYFRDRVRARWQEMKPVTDNLVMDNELGTNLMDRLLDAYGEDLRSNYSPEGANWTLAVQEGTYADQSIPLTYEENVEELRTWLIKRIAWLDTQFGVTE